MAHEIEFKVLIAKKNLTFAEICKEAKKFDQRCLKTPNLVRQFIDRAVELSKTVSDILEFEVNLVEYYERNLTTQRYAETKGIKNFTEAKKLFESVQVEEAASAKKAYDAIGQATESLSINVGEKTSIDKIADMAIVACLRQDVIRKNENLSLLATQICNRIKSHEELMYQMQRFVKPPEFRWHILTQWAWSRRPRTAQEVADIFTTLYDGPTTEETEAYSQLIYESSVHIVVNDPMVNSDLLEIILKHRTPKNVTNAEATDTKEQTDQQAANKRKEEEDTIKRLLDPQDITSQLNKMVLLRASRSAELDQEEDPKKK